MGAQRTRILVATFAALLPIAASGEVGNPDHTIWGGATIFDAVPPNDTPIELRSARDGRLLASYPMHSDARLGGRYALRIPMDDAGDRVEGLSRPGDPVRAFVGGRLAAETTVGSQGTAVRLDLDPKNLGNVPTIDVTNTGVFEGNAGTTALVLPVVLSGPATETVTLGWRTRDASAIGGAGCGPGVDFVNDMGTVTLAPGVVQGTIALLVCGDTDSGTTDPGDETLALEIGAVGNALAARGMAIASILDDDDRPGITVDALVATEPPTGAAGALFRARLSRPAPTDVTFAYATQDLTAVAGVDYAARTGIARIAAGQLEAAIAMTVLADATPEPPETFRLVLSNPQGAAMAQSAALATIVDPRYVLELDDLGDVPGGEGGVADLLQPSAIALSPDGRHAYVGVEAGDAVLQFARDASGPLTFQKSYSAATSGFANGRFDAVRDVEISADGRHVYVAARGNGAVTVLARDATSGDLAFVQAQGNGPDADAAGGRISGLDGALALALAPDGRHLYVAGSGADSVVAFARDTTTGRLAFIEAERHGVDDAGDAAAVVAGLDEPYGLTVSPDGAQVYIAARASHAIAVFSRTTDAASPAFGRLAYAASHVDGTPGLDGLAGASAVAVSADGLHLYATGAGDHALVLFDRTATGALAWRRQWRKGEAGVAGLGGARALRIAPNGRHVFVAGYSDHTVSVFARVPAGDLALVQTLVDGQGTMENLAGPAAVEASGDDRHVYVAAALDNALVMLRRTASEAVFKDGFE